MGSISAVGFMLVFPALITWLLSLFSFVPQKDKYALRVIAVSLAITSIAAIGWPKFEQNPVHLLSLLGTYLVWVGALEFSQKEINVKRLIVGTILGLWCGVISLMVKLGWSVMFTPTLSGLLSVTFIMLPMIRKK